MFVLLNFCLKNIDFRLTYSQPSMHKHSTYIVVDIGSLMKIGIVKRETFVQFVSRDVLLKTVTQCAKSFDVVRSLAIYSFWLKFGGRIFLYLTYNRAC